MKGFVTSNMRTVLHNNVIKSTFPNLNPEQQLKLLEMLEGLINWINNRMSWDLLEMKEQHSKWENIAFNTNMSNNDKIKYKSFYWKQLTQNNYRDSKGLLLLLLPYIDSNDFSDIRDLSQIWTEKDKDGKYKYTNIQYGRFNRSTGNDVSFSEKMLTDNYYLLLKTIDYTGCKFFVNWLDILPINTNDISFKNTERYTDTLTKYLQHNLKEAEPKFSAQSTFSNENGSFYNNDKSYENYKGLSVDNIYDTISNFLYNDIKAVKWLIYNIYDMNSKTIVTHIQKWDNLLQLHNIVNKEQDWDELVDTTQKQFAKEINGQINKISKSKMHQELFRAFLLFYGYDRQNNNTQSDDGFIYLVDMYDGVDDITQISTSKIIKSAKSLNAREYYSFFYKSIMLLKQTWYGNKIISKGQIIKNYAKNTNNTYTWKHIYNFAKSLTHNNVNINGNKTYYEYPRLFRGLSPSQKNIVLNRLNNSNRNKSSNFFNISKNISRAYGLQINDPKIRKINKEIEWGTKNKSGIRDDLISIVFDVMYQKGILSHFIPNEKLTNDSELPSMVQWNQWRTAFKRQFQLHIESNDNIWGNTYHFLANKKYNELEKVSGYGYLDFMKNKLPGGWFTTYAMNWISQIGFFHRYLNNQVIYVTGATGVGKSSQVPKLLLYATLAVDYRVRSRTVITQPRVNAAVQNAQSISTQMFLPIIDQNNNKIPNYQVGFRHKEESHEDMSGKVLRSLSFQTDGKLYSTLRTTGPLLRTGMKTNMYDIVGVDESHEHNPNMDLILSLMKQTLYYNKEIKLVIISATMDEDEPSYRQFYRNINDNLMYPPNRMNSQLKYDRINVDRRLHISPPGQTTRFDIQDVYRPNKSPEEVVSEILGRKEFPNSDILVFQPTQSKIMKTVNELNKNTPPYVIAIPFYKNLPDDNRAWIENMTSSTKPELRIGKDELFDSNFKNATTVPKGTYRRIIIVATNIAEASITIPTLQYMVDTGTRYTMVYDWEIGQDYPKLLPISETSRMQRRGRVGRVADGIAYYCYEQGKMANNKTIYSISTSDISDTLLILLTDTPNPIPLFPNDPHNSVIPFKSITSLSTQYPGLFAGVVSKQYLIDPNDNNWVFSWKGDNSQYDYQNQVTPPMVYEGYNYKDQKPKLGYTSIQLEDRNGEFFIVHPDESETGFRRNRDGTIANGITGKISKTFKDLQSRLLVTTINKKDYFQTEFGKYIGIFSRELENISSSIVIGYIFSKRWGVIDDYLLSVSFFSILTDSLSRLISTKDNNKNQRKEFKQQWSNCEGDMTAFVTMGNEMLDIIFNGRSRNPVDLMNNNTRKTKLAISNFIKERWTNIIIDNSSIARLNSWCKYRYINPITAKQCMLKYFEIKSLILSYNLLEDNPFEIGIDKKKDGLKRALLVGFGKNVIHMIPNTPLYTSSLSPLPELVLKPKSGEMFTYDADTLLRPDCMSTWLLSIGGSGGQGTKGWIFLERVTQEQIANSVPFLFLQSNTNRMKNIYQPSIMKQRALNLLNDDIQLTPESIPHWIRGLDYGDGYTKGISKYNNKSLNSVLLKLETRENIANEYKKYILSLE